MAKRLIKFRGTNDFARVQGRSPRPKQPSYTWNGNAWVLSEGGDGTDRGPRWLACNPPPAKPKAPQGVMYINFTTVNNGNRGGMVAGGFALGIAGAVVGGLPGALVGVGLGAGLGSFGSTTKSAGAWQPISGPYTASFNKFNGPCPKKDPLSFSEPTFTEFQQQYAAYLAGRNNDQQNVNPLEMQ